MKKYIFINVFLHNLGFTSAGVIVYDDITRQAGFTYDENYISQNLPPLNPATLNWRKHKTKNFFFNEEKLFDKTFHELIPSSSDWSYKIILSRYPEFENMSPIEQLLLLESRTVGGLQSHLHQGEDESSIQGADWLEKIYKSSMEFYEEQIPRIPYLHAFVPLTTYGGVRPKCTYQDDDGHLWIAKFNTPDDDFNMAKVEQVCMNMAQDLELPIAHSQVLSLENTDIFLSYRFDRQGDIRKHSLPFFALADDTQQYSNDGFSGKNPLVMKDILSYSDFQTKDTLLLVQKFLYDIAVNNTDNHLRNIRLILNDKNLWEVAPLFDITMTPFISDFVYNPARLKTSNLHLDNPNLASHMATTFGVSLEQVQDMIDKTKNVTEKYEDYCIKHGLNDIDIEYVSKAINIGKQKNDEALKPRAIKVMKNYPRYTR